MMPRYDLTGLRAEMTLNRFTIVTSVANNQLELGFTPEEAAWLYPQLKNYAFAHGLQGIVIPSGQASVPGYEVKVEPTVEALESAAYAAMAMKANPESPDLFVSQSDIDDAWDFPEDNIPWGRD